MGKASRSYCKSTPISKMGFTQKASCKAQGIIPRTSKKYKGKLIKSDTYKRKKTKVKSRKPKMRFARSKSTQINKSLYSSGKNKPKTKTGYGSAEKAKMTLKNIKGYPKIYQLQIVNTMYNRAKYHRYQTQGMKDAIKIFRRWLSTNK